MVVGTARCLLKSKGVPNEFWGEAVTTAVHLLNCAPTKSLRGMTPYESWHGDKPAVSYFRTFGCIAHVKITRPHLQKLDDRSLRTVFIGYEHGQSKAWRVYDPVGKRVDVTRDTIFDEAACWDWGASAHDPGSFVVDLPPTVGVVRAPAATPPTPPSPTAAARPSTPASPTADTPSDTPTPSASPVHQVNQGRGVADGYVSPPPDATPDAELVGEEAPCRYRTLESVDHDLEAADANELLFASSGEPITFQEAEPHAAWRAAMMDEMASIEENKTWSLTTLPAGKRAIGLKWVYKLKKNSADEVIKHKARLVAKGYVQRAGVDFDEVFALVTRLDSVRLLLAIAAHSGWEVHHLDVKSAFLNGELEEEVYVTQPPGFERAGEEEKVLRLSKALYGLRQAPRAWNAKLDDTLLTLGFQRSPSDHAVYMQHEGNEKLLLGVYVDDLMVTGTSVEAIMHFKDQMQSMFAMSDLGLLSFYLGIEVQQSSHSITLKQAAYAAKLVEKAGLSDCNPVHIPMEPRLKLSKDSQNPAIDKTLYRSIIGGLRYLVQMWPDITFDVGFVSRFIQAPTMEHWAAVKHLVRYIAGTLHFGCRYERSAGELRLIGYSDADHAGDIDDRKSTTGMVFLLRGSVVSWQSQKQKAIAILSCESEYMAASAVACQGIWLRRMLGELLGKNSGSTTLFIDNKSAI
jgi:hypothetical protein